MVEISKILSDTWDEINASTDNIRYFRNQIRESNEAIDKYDEKRKLLGSFRDFLSKQLDNAIEKAVTEKERRDAEKEEVDKFDLVFSKFLGDVKTWRETIDSFVDTQINPENASTSSSYTTVKSDTPMQKSNMPIAWERDRDMVEAGSSSGTKSGKKRLSSTPVWKPRVKPYKIPKKVSSATISTPEKLSKSLVIPDPHVVVDSTQIAKANEDDDCVITGQYQLPAEIVKEAIDNAVAIVQEKKDRDYASEGARPKITKEDGNNRERTDQRQLERAKRDETKPETSRKSIVDLGLQDPAHGRVADFANQLLPKQRGPVEVLEEFTREILIRANLNSIHQRRWTRIHISAQCRYNWIGETAVRELLNPNTEGGSMSESRIEDKINHQYNCVRDVRFWVRPEITIGSIVFREKFLVVPKKHTQFFAPMRVQLGRGFCRRYLKDVNLTRKEITLVDDCFREFCQYEIRRADDLFDFDKKARQKGPPNHATRRY